jgi:hypothetical protein
MAAALSALREAGHFDYYPHYSYSLPCSCSCSEAGEAALRREQQLLSWSKCLSDIRRQFYFINYFDIKRCHGLAVQLRECSAELAAPEVALPEARLSELAQTAKSFMCFLNVNATEDESLCRDVAVDLVKAWEGESLHSHSHSAREGEAHAAVNDADVDVDVELLVRQLAHSMEVAFSQVPTRYRELNIQNLDNFVNVGKIKIGK